jgi:thiamine-phosphate pyrophosphorylase
MIRTSPVHNVRELVAAERRGVSALLVSPVFATRSHPGGRALGYSGFGTIAHRAKAPVIALGGMTARRARALRRFGIHGWAAIDAWI